MPMKPPGGTDTGAGTPICTPEVCAWGATETVQVPPPAPASERVSSWLVCWSPGVTSILWNESDCGSVKISGLLADATSVSPEPSRSTDASCVRAVFCHAAPAVDMSADLTWATLQPGCSSSRSAAAPATCGVAIDVPEKTEKVEPVVSGGVDDRTSRPG